MLHGTKKCPICGRPYKWFSHYAGDQSACRSCVAEAENQTSRPDTEREKMRRKIFWGGGGGVNS